MVFFFHEPGKIKGLRAGNPNDFKAGARAAIAIAAGFHGVGARSILSSRDGTPTISWNK